MHLEGKTAIVTGAGRGIGKQGLNVTGPYVAAIDPVKRSFAALDPAADVQFPFIVE